MLEVEKWTDKELIEVYDLQKRYAEKIVDFVRNGEENDVYKFLNLVPELHSEDEFKIFEKEIYKKFEFDAEKPEVEVPQGRYVYKDLSEKWKCADNLREIFEEKYQYDFEEGRPDDLALFAGNEVALERYSFDRYQKLRREIPQNLQEKIKNLIFEYPKEIEEKAFKMAVYGYTDYISNSKLNTYRNEHMPEFEKVKWIIQGENANTIVGAYDLQCGLKMHQSELNGRELTGLIRTFISDKKLFELVYGEKSTELLKKASEDVIKLASRYDFANSDEKLPVLENHKTCLFGTVEQKLKIPFKNDPFCLSDKDYQIIIEDEAKKYEQEGFSQKYYPNRNGHKEYSNQSYKVVGRVQMKAETQPHWNIIFEDGKVITAQADEVISSQINERFYGEQVESFGKRPISKVLIADDKEKLTFEEGKEKISAIVKQLKLNGESVIKLKEFFEEERKNLSNSNAR